jgi:hypothetical protein
LEFEETIYRSPEKKISSILNFNLISHSKKTGDAQLLALNDQDSRKKK